MGHFMRQQLVCCIHHNSWCWIASDVMETGKTIEALYYSKRRQFLLVSSQKNQAYNANRFALNEPAAHQISHLIENVSIAQDQWVMEVHNYSRPLFSITDTSYQHDAQHKPPLTPLKHTFWESVMHKRDRVIFSVTALLSAAYKTEMACFDGVETLNPSSRLYCTAVPREPTHASNPE